MLRLSSLRQPFLYPATKSDESFEKSPYLFEMRDTFGKEVVIAGNKYLCRVPKVIQPDTNRERLAWLGDASLGQRLMALRIHEDLWVKKL